MKRHVVIITHRYHFHICQVAIDLVMAKYNPQRLSIVFDDVIGTKDGWNYLGRDIAVEIRVKYGLPAGVISLHPFSCVDAIHSEPNGWIRQQYVKLNLHKFLDNDEWLVIDGDTLINKDIDPWAYLYVNPADIRHRHHDFFLRYALDLEDKVAMYNGKPIEFSSVPIRLLNRRTLSGLEKYIYELHGTDVRGIRDSFTLKRNRDRYIELSEYDLIGNYQTFISKDILPLKELGPIFCPAKELYQNWDKLKNEIAVLHGHDNLPLEWYQQMGVNVNQNIWQILYERQN